MLRFLLLISLCLLIGFTGIGVLLSRQWGWSEYASPQLYVIYSEATLTGSRAFFAVSADSSDSAPLTASGGTLTALACSPDGHTLAYLTASGRLTVVNQAGIIYTRNLGAGYDAIDTANNGTVAAAKTEYGIGLIVNSQESLIPVPPDHIAYDPIKISSSGDTLWSHTMQGGIKLLSPSGERLLTLAPGASSPVWLAGEQMFTFTYSDGRAAGTGGIVDSTHQLVVPFRHSTIPRGFLSPDGRFEVLRFVLAGGSREQLYLVDPLTGQQKRQLTDDDVFHVPICFLTFRPEVLIAGS